MKLSISLLFRQLCGISGSTGWDLCYPVETNPAQLASASMLTRALLGYFRTLRTAGGGGRFGPPAISRTDGRRETGEAAFERSHREASRSIIKLTLKGHRSGQGQVKGKKCRFSLRRLLRLYHMKERLEIHT